MTQSDLEIQSQALTEADSEAIIGLNKVVAFDYRLCEVDAKGNKGEWFEKSKNRTLEDHVSHENSLGTKESDFI